MLRIEAQKTDLIGAKKKADVGRIPKGSNHVGLLFNKPPGNAGLFFNSSAETLSV
jgi:hypothetical protein